MAKNYWINNRTGEPIWSTSNSVPKTRRKEAHYVKDGRNFAETVAKIDKFCEENNISRLDVKRSYNDWFVNLPESEEKFNERVETWKREREKYKTLRANWLKKTKEAEAAKQRATLNSAGDGEFVVVRLTPAQYKKLMAGV